MGRNRDLVFSECYPPKELAFSVAEYGERLTRIRQRMAKDGINLLWMMAPESLYYISGYTCEWYQAQSPKQWPATSAIAVPLGVCWLNSVFNQARNEALTC